MEYRVIPRDRSTQEVINEIREFLAMYPYGLSLPYAKKTFTNILNNFKFDDYLLFDNRIWFKTYENCNLFKLLVDN